VGWVASKSECGLMALKLSNSLLEKQAMKKLLATAAIVSVALTGCASTEPTPPDFSKQTNATYTWDDSKSFALNWADAAVEKNHLKDAEVPEDAQSYISDAKQTGMTLWGFASGGIVEGLGTSLIYNLIDDAQDWKPVVMLELDSHTPTDAEVLSTVEASFKEAFEKMPEHEYVYFLKANDSAFTNNASIVFRGPVCEDLKERNPRSGAYTTKIGAHGYTEAPELDGCLLDLDISTAVVNKNDNLAKYARVELHSAVRAFLEIAKSIDAVTVFPKQYTAPYEGGVELAFPMVVTDRIAHLFTNPATTYNFD